MCMRVCARMYDVRYRSVSYTFEFIVVCVCVCMCVCVCGGGGGPYGALCGLFWWDYALRVYGISYLG